MANKRFRNAQVEYAHSGFRIGKALDGNRWFVCDTVLIKAKHLTVGSAMHAIDKYRSGK